MSGTAASLPHHCSLTAISPAAAPPITRKLNIPPIYSPRSRLPLPPLPAQLGEVRPSSAAVLGGTGLAVAVGIAASAFPLGASAVEIPLQLSSVALQEPSNALSLPTWAVHVSSVAEWITAMALVWKYGEETEFESWKGLAWGMVPLLGGAFCACTWHFFYNSESLEILVALQGALTVIGNFTMCIAAFRIYKSSQSGSSNT